MVPIFFLSIHYCYRWCPPKFICWNSTPQCDGMREQSFGEVIRIKQGHKSEALMNGISALVRVIRDLASFLLSIKKLAVSKPDEVTYQNPTLMAPWSQNPRLQNCEKYTSIVYKPPTLWYFVIAAQTDLDILLWKLAQATSLCIRACSFASVVSNSLQLYGL